MLGTLARYIAIDWSGAASPAMQRRHIAVADSHAGEITISCGRTRAETIAWLLEQARLTPKLVVGLDFAFSYPACFVKQEGAATIEDFWHVVADKGERWLSSCNDPFWGRPGRRCPGGHRTPLWRGFRRADRIDSAGLHPKSPFQIGGAGAVGTGSLRGIPLLLTLHASGFSIWPFHAPVFPMAMEIYPRSFTGPVRKSSREARVDYLRTHFAKATSSSWRDALEIAVESEDAFDALCSVAGMVQQEKQIRQLRQTGNQDELLEGAIFPAEPLEKVS